MIVIFFTFFLFASAIFVNKILLGILPLSFFVGIRMLCAGVILCLYTWKKHPLTIKQLKDDAVLLLFLSLFTTGLPTLLKAFALQHLNAAQTTLLGSIDPFVTALYAYILWHEKLSWNKVVGIAFGLCGLLLAFNIEQRDVSALWQISLFLPQFAAIGAVIVGRLGWIMIQKLLRNERYPGAQLNGIIMVLSGLFALIISYFVDDISILTLPIHTLSFWMLLLFTIIVGNVIAYTSYANIIKKHSMTLVSLAGFSVPLFVAILSKIFQDIPLSPYFIAAALLMLIGNLIFYKQELRQQKIL